MDPNILACPDRIDLLQQLVDSKAVIEINQGLDVRLVDDEVISLLNQMRLKRVYMAWDNPRDEVTPKKLEYFAEHFRLKSCSSKVVYVLCNYWSTFEEDLRRIYWLRDHNYDPYVMVYDKANADHEYVRLQGWVNNRLIWRKGIKFENYAR